MKTIPSSFSLLVVLVFVKCGPPTTTVELRSSKNGGLYEISDKGTEYKFYNNAQSFKLNTSTFIPFDDFERIQTEDSEESAHALQFILNKSGTEKFKQMTERNLQKQVCFVVDNKIMAAPIIQSIIANGFVQLNMPDKKTIDDIVKYLEK